MKMTFIQMPEAYSTVFHPLSRIGSLVIRWIKIWYTLSHKKAHLPHSIRAEDVMLIRILCNERIFDALNKIFLSKRLKRFVTYYIMLHLIPFASQSVNNSSRTGSLKAQLKALFWCFWSKIDAKQENSHIFKYSWWF